jgi:hypothetical protein
MGKNLIFVGMGGHAKSIDEAMTTDNKNRIVDYVDIKHLYFISKKNTFF